MRRLSHAPLTVPDLRQNYEQNGATATCGLRHTRDPPQECLDRPEARQRVRKATNLACFIGLDRSRPAVSHAMGSAGERHDVLVEDHLVGAVQWHPAGDENERNPLTLGRVEVGRTGYLPGDSEAVVKCGQTLRRER